MAMRKPFMPPNANPMAAAGAEGVPGMGQPPMPPQAGRAGMQPPMPMAGNNTPGGPQGPQMMGVNAGMPDLHAGGPTSPMNISSMLQARIGDRSAPPAAGMQPQSQSGQPGMAMMPWGDEGATGTPKRVPFNNGMGGEEVPGEMEGDADPDDPTGGAQGGHAAMMMKLLRTMGRI